MKEFFYLAVGFAVGIIVAQYWLGRRMWKDETVSKSLNQEQSRLKQEHLGKIMDYLSAHRDVSNTEVERMLNVSDATAERYLNELERQGRIVQLGKTGRSVIYRRA